MKKKWLVLFLVVAIVAGLTSSGFAADKKHFAGIRVVFFPGGNPGGPFASVVYRGAKAAEEDLGCNVQYIWSGWNPDKMVAQFKDAIALRPDAICIMGHPGVVAFAPLVDQAEARGIIVTSQNTSLPAIEDKYKADGFGYVGQELYPSGVMLAKGAAQRAGLKRGDKAMVWGLIAQETRGLRSKGIPRYSRFYRLCIRQSRCQAHHHRSRRAYRNCRNLYESFAQEARRYIHCRL